MFLVVVFNLLPTYHYPQNLKPSPIIFRQKCTFSHVCHVKSFFCLCVFVSIFINFGVACFKRKLTQEKGKKTNLSCKIETPEVLLVLSDQLRFFFFHLCHLPRKKEEYYVLFFCVCILKVYNLIQGLMICESFYLSLYFFLLAGFVNFIFPMWLQSLLIILQLFEQTTNINWNVQTKKN